MIFRVTSYNIDYGNLIVIRNVDIKVFLFLRLRTDYANPIHWR